jgi:hypothetical protein
MRDDGDSESRVGSRPHRPRPRGSGRLRDHPLHRYVPPADTDTTRYLCAAVHLDSRYCNAVLNATIRNPFRSIYPSFGVDLGLVVRHALHSERRLLESNRRLAWLRVGFVVLPLSLLVLTRADRAIAEQNINRLFVDLGAVAGSAVAVVAVASLVVIRSAWRRYTILGTYLLKDQHPADLVPDSKYSDRVNAASVPSSEDTNVVVFSGENPFVGSGFTINSSTFSLPLVRPGTDGDESSNNEVDTVELLRELERSFMNLGLSNLRTHRRLFIEGRDVRFVPEVLADPKRGPVHRVDERVVDKYVRLHDAKVRPYLCVEASSWRGQLVISTFIRVVQLEGAIFVEAATTVLPPLLRFYRQLDTWPIEEVTERRTHVAKWTARNTWEELWRSRGLLKQVKRGRRITEGWCEVHARRLRDRVLVDYGATSSIRAAASGGDLWPYFMERDGEMYVKVVQQRIFGTIASVFQDHGYDVAMVRQVQTNIITNTFVDNRQFGDNYTLSNVGSNNAVGPGAASGARATT